MTEPEFRDETATPLHERVAETQELVNDGNDGADEKPVNGDSDAEDNTADEANDERQY